MGENKATVKLRNKWFENVKRYISETFRKGINLKSFIHSSNNNRIVNRQRNFKELTENKRLNIVIDVSLFSKLWSINHRLERGKARRA